EIRKPTSFRPLDSALKNLNSYDWLILTSVNGVDAMWKRLAKLRIQKKGRSRLRVAAIGPATKKALCERGWEEEVVPNGEVEEAVVSSIKGKVKGRRVLLVRAKVARDVIPRELRKAGAHVDVIEAYETVVPETSRRRLQAALKNPAKSPHVVTFTSSSTVKNFITLVGRHANLTGIRMASIGPVTSATLRENKRKVDIAAKEFTIPGLVAAITKAILITTP